MAPIHFGFLLFDYQPIDVIGPADVLRSSSKPILQAMNQVMPVDPETIDHAPDFVFHHIGITLDPLRLSCGDFIMTPTTTVDDCPELDCLLVGGPDPSNLTMHPKHQELVRRHVAAGKLLFTTCTGAMAVAITGVLDGKNATINHGALALVKQLHPQVNWTKKQWVVDGNIWTAGGAAAGMDMVAHWVKEKFGPDVLHVGAAILDFEPRDIDGRHGVVVQRPQYPS